MLNVKVAVRIRPFSQRELIENEDIIVRKKEDSVIVTTSKIYRKKDGGGRRRTHRFVVDFCFDPCIPETCSQEAVYREIGLEIIKSMFGGYNACVLAYGHSASGKTYTMMGTPEDPGLTPRICQGLFDALNSESKIQFQVSASFLEIYNEKVRDLLNGNEEGGAGNFSLRVREHPKLGPYVQDLSRHVVTEKCRLLQLLDFGNKRRITAATENNSHSSRSHAVFTLVFRQTDADNYEVDKCSKVHLVDLAGSERAHGGQTKARLKEGANINKSLVTLGNVISALAENYGTSLTGKNHSGTKTWQPFVPYRDSVLTWLLKDTLGGNSHTVMIATVSPAGSCFNETLNTLRYAKRTKRIVNRPVINEDPKSRIIRKLREEIIRLRAMLMLETGKHLSEMEDDDFERRQSACVSESNENISNYGGEKTHGLERVVPKGTTEYGRGSDWRSDEIPDEKETGVNGSVIDSLRDTPTFRDSLESLSSASSKIEAKAPSDPMENRLIRDNGQNPRPGKPASGSARKSHRPCESDSRATNCAELAKKNRPDLIRGIAGHFKEGIRSTSSQSCTDVSNVLSNSEQSLSSSGSLDVDSRNDSQKQQPNRKKEIVNAVISRLYVAAKPEVPVRRDAFRSSSTKKETSLGTEVNHCKRARMKMFDHDGKISGTTVTTRKSLKRTVDADAQTDFPNSRTVRVKEQSVLTDVTGALNLEGMENNRKNQSRDEQVEGMASKWLQIHRLSSAEGNPAYSDDSLDAEKRTEEIRLTEFPDWERNVDVITLKSDDILGSLGDVGSIEGDPFSESEKKENKSTTGPHSMVFHMDPNESDEQSFPAVTVRQQSQDFVVYGTGINGTAVRVLSRDRGLYTIREYGENGDLSERKFTAKTVSGRSQAENLPEVNRPSLKNSTEKTTDNFHRKQGTISEVPIQPEARDEVIKTFQRVGKSDTDALKNSQEKITKRTTSKVPTERESIEESMGSCYDDSVFGSEDSITFVFLGPETSGLTKSIKTTTLESDTIREKEKKMTRSLSVDTALSRVARRTLESRATSLCDLGKKEKQVGTTEAPSFSLRETGCQCDLYSEERSSRDKNLLRYSVSTATSKDQQTNTLENTQEKKMNRLESERGFLNNWKRFQRERFRLKHGTYPSDNSLFSDRRRVRFSHTKDSSPSSSSHSSSTDVSNPSNGHVTFALTTFVKEAINLLKNLTYLKWDAGISDKCQTRSKGEMAKRKWRRVRKRDDPDSSLMRSGSAGGSENTPAIRNRKWPKDFNISKLSNINNCKSSKGKCPCLGFPSEKRSIDASGHGFVRCRGHADHLGRYLKRFSSPSPIFYNFSASSDVEDNGHVVNSRSGLEKNDDHWRPLEKTTKSTNEKLAKRRLEGCVDECTCSDRTQLKERSVCTWSKAIRSTFELNTFGPGSKHCSSFCTFCRGTDVELYCSNPSLNSECAAGRCRLHFYGHCPCSGVKLRHVSPSPRAYMHHLLAFRRRIVDVTTT